MSSAPDHEAREAAALAIAHLGSLGKPADKYRMVSVQNLLQGPDASPLRWRIGFKLREIIPARAGEEIGKGGEVFVEVDLGSHQVVLAKGGD